MENFKNLIRQNIRQYAMLLALVVIMIIFQITTNGVLLMPRNVSVLIMQNSYILILAIGMILCILTGGNIDLSVGAVVAYVSAFSALFSVTMGLPVVLSIFLALIMGLLAGMWQGFWIAYIKIPAFIVTLAGMLVFRGFSNMILKSQTILLPDLYVTIASKFIPDFIGDAMGGTGLHITTIVIGFIASVVYVIAQYRTRRNKIKYKFEVISNGFFIAQIVSIAAVINLFMFWLSREKGLPYVLLLLSVLVAIYTFITLKTVAGRHIYALGGNAKAAALSGVKTKRVMFWVYANMGLLSAVAGIVFAGRLNSASPTAGLGFELDAIAACFIGGASATGGVGTIMGAIIGGFIMGILNNGMSIMGVETYYQEIIKGLVLLFAVGFDVYSKSKAK
ncbi:MAG: sugar ABC transporter permease [Vallitaleaceae bacterium]|jgi:putative multiple sugar transport system permease protein|nr:sugar ABC transporter permease [Vallitaleaceae bacterium]